MAQTTEQDAVAQEHDDVTTTGDAVEPLHQKCGDNENAPIKAVRFDDHVKTISYEFDARMRKQIWCRKTDYKRFHHEKKETLRHFRHAQNRFQRIQEDIFCLRGFEAHLSARAVQQKLLHKVAALQAVLETQFDQKRTGDADPKRIQLEYYRVTTPARNQALERAALDAAEVDWADVVEQEDQSMKTLKTQIDRLLHIKAGVVTTPTIRSAASGPLKLRKSTANTA